MGLAVLLFFLYVVCAFAAPGERTNDVHLAGTSLPQAIYHFQVVIACRVTESPRRSLLRGNRVKGLHSLAFEAVGKRHALLISDDVRRYQSSSVRSAIEVTIRFGR